MALIDHLSRWLRDLVDDDTALLMVHDAVETTFAEVANDAAVMDGNTILSTADTEGLARWGIDLGEQRLPSQNNDQYSKALAAVYQGLMVDLDGIRFAVEKYGLTAQYYDGGGSSLFADLGFADTDALTIGAKRMFTIIYDEWDPLTIPDEADFAQRVVNSAQDVFRVKGRGVQFVPIFPSSVTP